MVDTVSTTQHLYTHGDKNVKTTITHPKDV